MNSNQPPADVDRWLTDFFQAELPKSFRPAPTVSEEPLAEPTRRGRRTVERGRWTLAVSVAALLTFAVYLSYGPLAQPTPATSSDLLQNGQANGNGTELDKALKRIQNK